MPTTLHGATPRYEHGLHQVGDGCWAWLQPNGDWGEANAGLVRGDGASAVVDTLWDQRLAREFLAAAAPQLADAPIRLVVNTHSDGDHFWGNAEMPPAADIVTGAASLEAMRAEASPAELGRLGALGRRVGPLPGPLGAMGRYVGAMLAPFEFGGVTLRFPDRTFSGEQTEDVGGRALRLIEVGPAHTQGDLVVHVPDAGVVYTADILFVDATPVMWVGPVEGWIAALDTLLGLDADTFVPGHGPVTDRAGVQAVRDYWEWLRAIVAREQAAARSPLDAARGDPRRGVRPLSRLGAPRAHAHQRHDDPPRAVGQRADRPLPRHPRAAVRRRGEARPGAGRGLISLPSPPCPRRGRRAGRR